MEVLFLMSTGREFESQSYLGYYSDLLATRVVS